MKELVLEQLEFTRLLTNIAEYAHSEASKEAVRGIRPFVQKSDIKKRLAEIREIRRLSQEGTPLSLSQFSDIAPYLIQVSTEGAVLEGRELAHFIPVLEVAHALALQLAERADLPHLQELAAQITGFPEILSTLKRAVDSEGNILDSASHELSQIRAQIRRLENKVRKRLEDIVRDERTSVFLQDDFITQRSGRWVIPVRMDSKGQVEGVVHDISKSGETAFVEPLSVISLSNELENAKAEEKSEELRILRSISARIRAVVDEMTAEYSMVIYLDMLSCIASFADPLAMQEPQIGESGMLKLIEARHPLLQLMFQRKGVASGVVPLDVSLGGDATVMVITGPNAGGKTIAIKTVGLLVLMALSGVPIPAASASDIPLIHNLLIDIGDEQSIEDSLSTFSGHIANITEILNSADARSLILIDELGTGTDPDEGAALACAILKELRKSSALVFATTHLTGIKGFVHKTEGMLNASMEFDQKTLSPRYKLRVGEPGQSYALETAKRYGLPDSLVRAAKEMLGSAKVEIDTLITDLHEKRAHYEKMMEAVTRQRAELSEREQHLKGMLTETERKQKELLASAYEEASKVVLTVKRQMYEFLDELKKKGKEKSREILKQVEAQQTQITEKVKSLGDGKQTLSINEIHEGDPVHVHSLGYEGVIVGINTKESRVRVRAGAIELEVPVSGISILEKKPSGEERGEIRVEAESSFSSRLNLVGKRVDDALMELEPFLNQASLAGLSEVAVIHGIGTGALSKAIREYLTGHPLVKHFRSGEQKEGGAGVTIVTLK